MTGAGDQTHPAVAAGLERRSASGLAGQPQRQQRHLLRLPDRPAGQSRVRRRYLVDDTSGADQIAPALACGAAQTAGAGQPKVFVCWQDARHASTTNRDTDPYVVEVRDGKPRANVFVGDDGTNVNQSDPALGVDHYGQPYVVWTDCRAAVTEVYSAATTLVSPTPLDSKTVVAATGGTVGTDPAAIQSVQDVSLVVPPGACQVDLNMTIAPILNPQVASDGLLGSYEFGPSGVDFPQPVTVTIPYATDAEWRECPALLVRFRDGGAESAGDHRHPECLPLRQSQRAAVSHDALHAVLSDRGRFSRRNAGHRGQRRRGGCALSHTRDGSPWQLLVPYGAIAVIMALLRHRDKKNRRCAQTLPRRPWGRRPVKIGAIGYQSSNFSIPAALLNPGG